MKVCTQKIVWWPSYIKTKQKKTKQKQNCERYVKCQDSSARSSPLPMLKCHNWQIKHCGGSVRKCRHRRKFQPCLCLSLAAEFFKRTFNLEDAMKWLNKTCQQESWAHCEKADLNLVRLVKKCAACQSADLCQCIRYHLYVKGVCMRMLLDEVCICVTTSCFWFSYFNFTFPIQTS